MENKQYQPKTGARCGCRRGVWRDNCPYCEGTGWTINFKSFHTKTMPEQWMVFWQNGSRIGSLEKTEHNKKQMESVCRLELIQKDITGTVHYEVHKK